MEPEIITKRMVGECSSSVTDSNFQPRNCIPITGPRSPVISRIFRYEKLDKRQPPTMFNVGNCMT